MDSTAQNRATRAYRARLVQRGIARFEVTAPEADRDLIRTLTRRLAEQGPDAERIRAALQVAVAGEAPKPSHILSALRRSPLVGADLDLLRPRGAGRRAKL